MKEIIVKEAKIKITGINDDDFIILMTQIVP